MNALTLQNRPIAELIPYARNPRKNDAVVNKMVAAIREFGFRIPIVAKSDGTVVDGHLRLKAAKELGLTEVPVVLADDLSDAQIKAFRLLANRSANWAEWDEELLKIELEDLAALDFDLELTGFDFDEIDRQLQAIAPEPFTEKPMKPPTIQPVPINRLGDYWQLGDHRVLCGDALDASSYTRLLGDKKADLTVSDPPYNVNYGANNLHHNQHRPVGERIANDNLGKDFPAFLKNACQRIIEKTSGAIYLCMATRELTTLYNAFLESGGYFSDFIIWFKNHFAIGHADYQRQYEPILYGWPLNAVRHWCGKRDQINVWQIDRQDSNPLHPTSKPVKLMGQMITNSSRKGDCVLDPFGGSGTTLMACEHHQRRCAMIELEPSYVDTIIERWQRHTHQKAIHEDSGLTYEALRQARLAESQKKINPREVE
jgi:DNA modification methylase